MTTDNQTKGKRGSAYAPAAPDPRRTVEAVNGEAAESTRWIGAGIFSRLVRVASML